tara:strand:- start:1691 stop:3415 length:1725 start_codon:yes stop_codon:yes gene_type:complete
MAPRPVVFDPNLGQDGEYRPASQEELVGATINPEDATPEAPAIPPEGVPPGLVSKEFVTHDIETGVPTVNTDPTTGQEFYNIAPDLIGGEIADPRIGVPGVNPNVTQEQLGFRRTARGRGFEGDMSDAVARNYVEQDRGRRGLVDKFGYATASGRLEDIVSSPIADLPEGAIFNAALINPNAPGTVQDAADANQYITTLPSVQQAGAMATDAQTVGERAAAQFEAKQQFDAISEQKASAALINDQIQMITAQEEEAGDMSTVRGQLTRLTGEFDGGTIPPWAEGPVAAAQQVMAARGLGSSSMTASAITSSLMNTLIPIAQADASINAEFQRLNLNNRQQAEVQNAANLLTTDIKDIDNTQQAALFNTGNRVQSLFTDQSEMNAARRINAASDNQTQQFFVGLQQSVLNSNAAQKTAISQFNAGQANSLEQFRATQQFNAQQFNASNYTAIKQANTQWFRQVNTANTAAINAQNQFNATNVLNRSNTALNNQIQIMRDAADFTFNAAQNDAQRANNLAVATLQAEAAAKQGQEGGGSILGAAGGILGKIFGNFAGTEAGGTIIAKGFSLIPGFN